MKQTRRDLNRIELLRVHHCAGVHRLHAGNRQHEGCALCRLRLARFRQFHQVARKAGNAACVFHRLAHHVKTDHSSGFQLARVQRVHAVAAVFLLHRKDELQRRVGEVLLHHGQHVRHAVTVVRAERCVLRADVALVVHINFNGVMRKIMRALGCFHAHHIHVPLQHHDRRVFVPFGSRLAHDDIPQFVLFVV